MIHWSPDTPDPSLSWIVGSATFTTRLSSMGMNSPNTIATRTHHFRPSAGGAVASDEVLCKVLAIRVLLAVSWGRLARIPPPVARLSERSLIVSAHSLTRQVQLPPGRVVAAVDL